MNTDGTKSEAGLMQVVINTASFVYGLSRGSERDWIPLLMNYADDVFSS